MPPTPGFDICVHPHRQSVLHTVLALGHLDGPLPSPPGSQEAFISFQLHVQEVGVGPKLGTWSPTDTQQRALMRSETPRNV